MTRPCVASPQPRAVRLVRLWKQAGENAASIRHDPAGLSDSRHRSSRIAPAGTGGPSLDRRESRLDSETMASDGGRSPHHQSGGAHASWRADDRAGYSLMATPIVASPPAPAGSEPGDCDREIATPLRGGDPRRRTEEPLETRVLAQSLYAELRALAAATLADEWAPHSLQPTALAHEAFVKLVTNVGGDAWDTPGRFFAAAAEAMRRVLVDSARRRKTLKRGGDAVRIDFVNLAVAARDIDAEMLLVDDVLDALAAESPVAADVVRLRYFGGFTLAETARVLSIPERTVGRRWAFARAWLHRRYLDADAS